jgi:hypothetical protein
MLDGLDRVEWSGLRHAFGTAEDVPHLIRALTSPLPNERQAAFRELCGNIWHQGTVYEATSYAVPFLIELVASNETPDRHYILSYLGQLADGSSYVDVHKSVVKFSQEQLSRQLEVELGWVAQTRKLVKSGEALYLDNLNTNERRICCAAGYVLSRFPEEGERYWAPLRARYDDADSDELVRCGLAIVTKEFSAKGTSDTQWLLKMFEQEKHRSVRVALAVSIALSDEQRRDDALRFLIANVLSDAHLDQSYHAQPWDRGEAIWHIVQALCASKRGRRMLVSRFNELLFQDAPRDRLDYLRYVLQGKLTTEPVCSELIGALRPLTIPDD